MLSIKNIRSPNITHLNIIRILGLIRPDVIERMQGYVYDNLQRTLDEYPKCLDEPGIAVDFNSPLSEMFRTSEVRCEVQN